MGHTFLEFMKEIGIFIICAQSLIHFAAGKSYEKYIKLLVGIMILAQFISPVHSLLQGGSEGELWAEVERFEQELESKMQQIDITYAQEDTATQAIEDEIEEKLKGKAGEYGFEVVGVQLTEDAAGLVITLSRQGGEQIEVEKIEVGEGGGQLTGQEGIPEELKEEFGVVLGIDAGYLEVGVM